MEHIQGFGVHTAQGYFPLKQEDSFSFRPMTKERIVEALCKVRGQGVFIVKDYFHHSQVLHFAFSLISILACAKISLGLFGK